jgi:hypothetical protein
MSIVGAVSERVSDAPQPWFQFLRVGRSGPDFQIIEAIGPHTIE